MSSLFKNGLNGFQSLKQARKLVERGYGSLLSCLPGSSKSWGPPRGLWDTVDEALAAKAPGVSIQSVIPAYQAEYPPGVTVDPDPHWKLDKTLHIPIPEQRLARLENGRLFGDTPIVIGQDDCIFRDLSTLWRPYRHRAFFSPKLPEPRKIKGRVVLLGSASAANNINHLLVESIPGLKQLELAGIGMDDIDHFVVNGSEEGVIRVIVDLFDIPEEKRIYLTPDLHIECEELILPTLTGRNSVMQRWVNDFVKERVTAKIAEASLDVHSPEKIYISREGSSFRRLVNREEIEAILKRYGYEEVRAENHPFLEQAALFAKAKFIVTVHGAGLTHLIFAPSDCRLLELHPARYVNPAYFFLARECGQPYHYLIDRATREIDTGAGLGVNQHLRFDDVDCDPELFEKAIQKLEEEE